MPLRRSIQRTALAACVALGASSSPADEPPPSSNVVEFVTQVQGSAGVVRCGLFRQQGWLKDPVQPAAAKIHGGKAVCVFRTIKPGVYALSAFHDENNNGKLDTNFLGMPVEDYCASRNARGTLGPPSFDDAKFRYGGGTKRLEARMK
jgi:uncharacterized protein (DUF2141 family)